MPAPLQLRDLTPLERRVALMRVAGSSTNTIAYMIETSDQEICNILKRPHVADFMLKIQATFATDLAPAFADLNEAIEHEAHRAFQVEKEVMERLFEMRESVRAQIGAAATAQDILDRAGKRAPVRTQTLNAHVIAPASLEQIARILNDTKAVVVVDTDGSPVRGAD